MHLQEGKKQTLFLGIDYVIMHKMYERLPVWAIKVFQIEEINPC